MKVQQEESDLEMSPPNKVNTRTIQNVWRNFSNQLDFEDANSNVETPDSFQINSCSAELVQTPETELEQRNDIIWLNLDNSSIHKNKQTVWTSVQLSSRMNGLNANNLKSLLRGLKRFLMTDFKRYSKQDGLAIKDDLWTQIQGYVSDRIGKSQSFDQTQMWLALILSPKKALQLYKEASDQSNLEISGLASLNDLIFKFSSQKTEKVFKNEGNKNLLNLYAKSEERETADFSNEISILLSL